MPDRLFDFVRELLSGPAIKSRSPQDLLAEFGEVIRLARIERNMNRKELARRSGISERYVAVLEQGRGNVTMVLLFRLVAALQQSQQEPVSSN